MGVERVGGWMGVERAGGWGWISWWVLGRCSWFLDAHGVGSAILYLVYLSFTITVNLRGEGMEMSLPCVSCLGVFAAV